MGVERQVEEYKDRDRNAGTGNRDWPRQGQK